MTEYVLRYKDFTGSIKGDGDIKPRYVVIWNKLTDDADLTTPEGRTDFDKVLRDFLQTIDDLVLQEHYTTVFRRLRGMAMPDLTLPDDEEIGL